MFVDCTIVSWCIQWKTAQVSRIDVLQVLFYVGWLSEFVLLCSGKLVVDNCIWIVAVCSIVWKTTRKISGLHNGTVQVFALLGYCAAQVGRLLQNTNLCYATYHKNKDVMHWYFKTRYTQMQLTVHKIFTLLSNLQSWFNYFTVITWSPGCNKEKRLHIQKETCNLQLQKQDDAVSHVTCHWRH